MIKIELDDLRAQARAIGTDAEYLEWLRRQASCISGKYSEWLESIGEWRNPACHVRRAVNAGTACKPEFSAVPLTHDEHHDQSVKGEAYCLGKHSWTYPWTKEAAAAFFDNMAAKYLAMWIMSR